MPTAAALGAGAAVAIGQIPGSNGTITACYQNVPAGVNGADNQYGALRVIDPSQTTATDTHVYSCDPSTEQTITWNQQGPMGPTGAQGQTGQQGQTGSTGPPSKIVPESTFSVKSPPYEIFLKVAGVPGDNNKKSGISGTETVSEFDLGAAGEISSGRKVTVQSFDIVRQGADAGTFALQHDLIDGTKLGTAEVIVESKTNSKSGDVVGQWEFKDVYVTSYQVSGNKAQPTESIGFSFSEVKTSLGAGQQKLTTGWNTAKNVGFNLTTAKTS